MEKGKPSVCQLLQSESSACIVRNHAIFKSILKAVMFCSNQNISLRGHCEQTGCDSNPGNFSALVDFCYDAGDSILADDLKTCDRNAQCISPKLKKQPNFLCR